MSAVPKSKVGPSIASAQLGNTWYNLYPTNTPGVLEIVRINPNDKPARFFVPEALFNQVTAAQMKAAADVLIEKLVGL